MRVLWILATVFTLTLQQGLATPCARELRTIRPDSFQRSQESIDFWRISKETPPISFEELAKIYKTEFIHGIPTFESRPENMGFTDWVMAFARSYPLDSKMINAARSHMENARKIFQERMKYINESKGEGIHSDLMDIAMRSQYYSEMKSALSGELMPFPEQGPEALEEFFKRKDGGTLTDLFEAHSRLYLLETKLTNNPTSQQEIATIQNHIDFYKTIIARIPERIKARFRTLK